MAGIYSTTKLTSSMTQNKILQRISRFMNCVFGYFQIETSTHQNEDKGTNGDNITHIISVICHDISLTIGRQFSVHFTFSVKYHTLLISLNVY